MKRVSRKVFWLEKLAGKVRRCLEEYETDPKSAELFVMRLVVAEKIKALINVRRLPLMGKKVDETNPLGAVAKKVNQASVRHSEMNIQAKADFYRECLALLNSETK